MWHRLVSGTPTRLAKHMAALSRNRDDHATHHTRLLAAKRLDAGLPIGCSQAVATTVTTAPPSPKAHSRLRSTIISLATCSKAVRSPSADTSAGRRSWALA